MFSGHGLCLAIFDEDEGPVCIYFKGIDKVVADKVAVKSMVGAMTFNQRVDDGEAIIPLQEEERTVFVFNFAVHDETARGGVRIGTLNLVVRKEDTLNLYRLAPVISEHSKRIVQDIRKYYVYRQPLPQVLINSLESVLSIPESENASLPPIFKEYLIQLYLSKNTTFHRSILEKTSSISQNEELFGNKIDIVGRDKDQNIVWIFITRNFLRMSGEEKSKLYTFLDKLKDIPSLEVVFILNELGLGKNGLVDINMIEKVTRISRINGGGRRKFDICGIGNNENIIWALLSKNFLVMSESEIDELNKKIYQLKRENPSMEAFFVLAEVLRTAKIQPQNLDLEGKPAKLEKIKKVKNEYQSLKKSIKESKS